MKSKQLIIKDTIRNHWSKFPYKNQIKHQKEIIDLTIEENDEQEYEGSKFENFKDMPLFKLVKSDFYDVENITSPYLISMDEIFGDKLVESLWLFSYQFEMKYILSMIPKNVYVNIIAQMGTITESEYEKMFHIKKYLIKMAPYTSHHSKMIIKFFKDKSCQIIIPSNNFTYLETNLVQQVCWISPILTKCDKCSSSEFKKDLCGYLFNYPVDLSKLIKRLNTCNFKKLDELKIKFIYSQPKNLSNDTGLLLLKRKVDQIKNYYKKCHFFVQTSTIGSPVNRKNLLLDIMLPLLSCDVLNTKASILFPTPIEISKTSVGWNSSGWFHYHYTKNDQSLMEYIRMKSLNVFQKQIPYNIRLGHDNVPQSIKRRDMVSCHTKFYIMSNGEKPFQDLKWVLFTSHNLSSFAWGTDTKRPRNYECGILYQSSNNFKLKLTCIKDKIYNNDLDGNGAYPEILLPFWLPGEPYTLDDECFCASKTYLIPDHFGQVHLP